MAAENSFQPGRHILLITMSSSPTQPNKIWVFLLCLMTLLLYLLPLFFVELQGGEEAGFAAVAREMLLTGNYLQPHLHGDPVRIFPLYSWLIALFSFAGVPTLFSIRFPAVLSIWGLAVLCGLTARKSKGSLAGYMAAAVILTCFASMRIGFRAQTETLHAFLLAMAWFMWYRFGPQEQRWHHAWGLALLFVFLDVLAVGAKGIFLFYLPLLIARNPPKMLRQLQSAPHILMLGIFAVLTLFWIHFVCPQPFLPWNAISFTQPIPVSEGFFRHLSLFPCKVFFYLLPWSLLAWAPFCLALRQFEPTGTLGSFFRTLIFVPFVLILLWPGASPLLLFPALAPMAVLIGIHFEIVVNWYARFFRWIAKVLSALTLLGASAGTLFWLLVFLGNLELQPSLFSHGAGNTLALLLCVVSAVLAGLSVKQFNSFETEPLWKNLLWGTVGLRLMVLSFLMIPFWTIGNRKLSGLTLAGLAPANARIPVADPMSGLELPPAQSLNSEPEVQLIYLNSNYAYLVETFYLGKDILRLNALHTNLPVEAPVVYLLSSRQPAIPSRQWEPISPTVNMALKRRLTFQLPSRNNQYRGLLFREVQNPVLPGSVALPASETLENTRRNFLRLYRGVLKQE
ncbi:MAG: hypothetical protein WCT05_04625 [Lentisphaeria bacterium]